jgi:hypothetical protein
MKSIRTLVIALALGLVGVVAAANSLQPSTPPCCQSQADCCADGASCCADSACCAAHQAE